MAAWRITEQDEIRNTFARNLRRLMNADGISQKELAEKMQTGPSTVSAWVNGGKLPRTETIRKLADLLDVEVAELLSNVALPEKKSTERTVHPSEVEAQIQKMTDTPITLQDIAMAQSFAKLNDDQRRLLKYMLAFFSNENENSR